MGYKVVRLLVLCAWDTGNSLYFFCICFFLFFIPHVHTSTMFLAKPYTSENIWNSNFLMKILLYTVNFKYLILTKLSTTTQHRLNRVKNHWGECLALNHLLNTTKTLIKVLGPKYVASRSQLLLVYIVKIVCFCIFAQYGVYCWACIFTCQGCLFKKEIACSCSKQAKQPY